MLFAKTVVADLNRDGRADIVVDRAVGTNGSKIIENDIPGGGRPVVTLSPGQDFNSTRCGKWEKQ